MKLTTIIFALFALLAVTSAHRYGHKNFNRHESKAESLSKVVSEITAAYNWEMLLDECCEEGEFDAACCDEEVPQWDEHFCIAIYNIPQIPHCGNRR